MSKYSQSTSSNSDSNSLSQSMSEKFGHTSKEKQCEGNRFNINLLFIGVMFLFLFTSIKSEIIPKNLFSKEKLMDSLNKFIPESKQN